MRYADCLVKQVARPIDQVDRTAILDLLFAYNRLYGVGPGCLADLSRLVNVPVYLLQQIVSGQKVDTALTLDVLADAIGCSQSELSYKHYFVDHAIKELDSIELETLDDSYGWRDTTTYKVKQIEFGPLKAKLPNKKFTDALMYAKSKLVIETFNQRLLEMAKRYDVRPRLIDYVKWYEFGATPEQFGFEFDESGRYLLDSESREILAHFPIDDLVEPTANENISKYMDRLESVLDDVDCGGKPDIIKQRAPKSRYKVKNVGGRAKIGSVTQSEAKKIKAKHNQSKQ
jgi:hypothetical protein